MKVLAFCGIAFIGLSARNLRADVNLIVNGSFELPQVSGDPIGVSSVIPADWIVTNSPAATYTNIYDLGSDQNTYYDGTQSILLNSDHLGTVSLAQSFATTAGYSYTLTFALNNEKAWAGTDPTQSGSGLGGSGNGDAYFNPAYGYGSTISNPADPATQVLVTVGDQNVLFNQTASGWNLETLVFQATSSLTTLTFTDSTPGGNQSDVYSSPLIDDVQVLTPEPGFYGLLAIGLAALGLFSRRRLSSLRT